MAMQSNERTSNERQTNPSLFLSAIRANITSKAEGWAHSRSAEEDLRKSRSSFFYSPVGSDDLLEIPLCSSSDTSSRNRPSISVEIQSHVHTLSALLNDRIG